MHKPAEMKHRVGPEQAHAKTHQTPGFLQASRGGEGSIGGGQALFKKGSDKEYSSILLRRCQ